jgi:hypothetical protein
VAPADSTGPATPASAIDGYAFPVTRPSRPGSHRFASIVVVAAMLVAGCAAPGSSMNPTGAPTSPGGSGAASCSSAPTPPDNLAGWGPPGAAPEIVPLLISGLLACGQNRVLFTLLDAESRPIGAPDRTAKVAIYNLGRDPSTPIATADGEFVWAIENERGIYILNTSFPEAGRYGAEFTTTAGGSAPTVVRLTFDVHPSSPVVKVGDPAPASKTPTLSDVGGDATQISTDATPVPAFYETSVDQALADGKPFALIFATPKFCTSAQCGPTLDRMKPFLARYPEITFINVEPYKLKLVDGVLQPDTDAGGQLQTAPVTDEWRLFTEPAVFVVDREGIVRAAFELIFSDAELTAALDAVK